MTSKEREVLLKVIDLYRNMPHLWEKNHKDYSNKVLRDNGFRMILDVYKNCYETATVREVKKKLQNMRTGYIKELNKVIASQNEEEVYVPTLWYFDAFSFLGNTKTESYHLSTTDPLKYDRNQSSSSDEERIYAGSPSEVSTPRSPPKRMKMSRKQDSVRSSIETPTQSHRSIYTREEDCEVYGKAIGIQLRDLKNKELAIAQKLISDVIYYAKLGKLTEDAHVVLSRDEHFI